jgi:hypothetical protein
MAVVSRWDEFARHRQIIRIVKDQQPILVRAKPALRGSHCKRLVLRACLWQSQNAYDRRVTRAHCFSRIGGDPKCVGVFCGMPVGVFDNRLRFPNSTQPTQRRSSLPGECLLELRQHRLPTGKERVATRKIRKRQFMTRRAALIF